MTDDDELARRRAERAGHPSRPQLPTENLIWPTLPSESFRLSQDDAPSDVESSTSREEFMGLMMDRLTKLTVLVGDVAEELERRGLHDLAERLRKGIP